MVALGTILRKYMGLLMPFDPSVSALHQSWLEAEITVFNHVRDQLQAQANAHDSAAFQKMSASLEKLREETKGAKEEDLPAIFDQMNNLRSLLDREANAKVPDLRAPYFARMELEEQGKTKNILLGYQTYLEISGYPIIDWRNAPIAKVYFQHREGDDYEIELGEVFREGVITKRTLLTCAEGELVHVTIKGISFRKNAAGVWCQDSSPLAPGMQGGAGTASRPFNIGTGRGGQDGHEIAALLDPKQFEVLQTPADESMLITGSAGCGKTTIALHRIASLVYRDPKFFVPSHIVVLSPTAGLCRLTKLLLDGLGLKDVRIDTFDRWLAQQTRKTLSKLPSRYCQETPFRVIQFKRHPAMRALFKPVMVAKFKDWYQQIQPKFASDTALAQLMSAEALDQSCALDCLDAVEAHIKKTYAADSSKTAYGLKQLAGFKNLLYRSDHDRRDLLLRKEHLDIVVQASGGDLTAEHARAVHQHAVNQMSAAGDDSPAGLTTLDGQLLEDGEQGSVSGSLDYEDIPILLSFLQFKTGKGFQRFGKMAKYSHILLDEAQDIAPMELEHIGKALKSKGQRGKAPISIAGDDAQQTDDSAWFTSWDGSIAELNVPITERTRLDTSYRSPGPISRFAHHVLGPFAPAQPPKVAKEGVPVTLTSYASEGHLATSLRDVISDLTEREPLAAIAVIASKGSTAQRLWGYFKDLDNVRLAIDGEFAFKPGVDFTEVAQVKGLEFDYVIVPDAGFNVYKDTREARKKLHLAATRAIHQLWLIAMVRPSPWIEEALAAAESEARG